MSEFLEHCPDPRAVVKKAARVLEPGGLLVAGTANADSLARLLRGPRWGYYMPGHVVYLSARHLRRLLEEEGFAVHRIFRGDDRGGLLDPALAGLHDAWVPGRMLRAMPLPRGWTLGAGMVAYAVRKGA
jgi:SAM-dependent methyltransferase